MLALECPSAKHAQHHSPPLGQAIPTIHSTRAVLKLLVFQRGRQRWGREILISNTSSTTPAQEVRVMLLHLHLRELGLSPLPSSIPFMSMCKHHAPSADHPPGNAKYSLLESWRWGSLKLQRTHLNLHFQKDGASSLSYRETKDKRAANPMPRLRRQPDD